VVDVKIKLDDVILAFISANNHAEQYYHKPTGKIIYIEDPFYSGIEVDEELEEIENNWENYIRFPNAFEINTYSILEEFVWRLPPGCSQERLERAIHGKGAFRRFKQIVHQLGMEDQWYTFQDSYYRNLAVEWCSIHDIDYE